jgi:hypothetical protein
LLEVIVVRKRNAVHVDVRRLIAKVGRNGALGASPIAELLLYINYCPRLK